MLAHHVLLATAAAALRAPLPRARVFSSAASERPLSNLLEVCKIACDAVTPLVHTIYQDGDRVDAVKADRSDFTLADGLVQSLLVRLLLSSGCGFVGEEEVDASAVDAPPFVAGGITAPPAVAAEVVAARDRLDELAARLEPRPEYARLVAFLDPIDGTREFVGGRGGECSVCVGFADGDTGEVRAGLVYRPLTTPPTYAYGAASEGCAESALLPAPAAGGGGGLLVTRQGKSEFLAALAEELDVRWEPTGGAGNKFLRLLEDPDELYIQDRGLSRWDTCAAQGVLEAHGGAVVKLSAFERRGELEPYTYRRGDRNADFEPGLALLTRYNARDAAAVDGAAVATAVEQLKPHANTCGLLALPAAACAPPRLQAVREAVARAAAREPPKYD